MTTVEAEAVLLFGFVSGGVVLLITTTFVFVPVALTVALIVIGTDSPTARLEIVQSSAWAVVVQVPFPRRRRDERHTRRSRIRHLHVLCRVGPVVLGGDVVGDRSRATTLRQLHRGSRRLRHRHIAVRHVRRRRRGVNVTVALSDAVLQNGSTLDSAQPFG